MWGIKYFDCCKFLVIRSGRKICYFFMFYFYFSVSIDYSREIINVYIFVVYCNFFIFFVDGRIKFFVDSSFVGEM